MNRKLFPVLVLGTAAAVAVTSFALACDKSASKTSARAASAATASGKCSTAPAAASTGSAAAVNAVAGSAGCPAHPTGGAGVCPYSGSKSSASAAAGCCAHDKAAATSAGCSAHGSSAKSAMAVPAGSGHACGGKGSMAGNHAHGPCDACADMAMCDEELKSAQAKSQVVQLKNGVMYVYTATDPQGVRSIQSAISRRNTRINALVTAESAKLCPDCKSLRGAMASGKLNREVINIEGGCINLVTTDDPRVVSRLYEMAGLAGTKSAKS